MKRIAFITRFVTSWSTALIVITCVGFAYRLAYFPAEQVIARDGATYARLAENLASGRGFVDLFGRENTVFPSLYPLIMSVICC